MEDTWKFPSAYDVMKSVEDIVPEVLVPAVEGIVASYGEAYENVRGVANDILSIGDLITEDVLKGTGYVDEVLKGLLPKDVYGFYERQGV